MPKKNPRVTPRSQIKSSLRRLFLRSRERAAALKRDKATCRCGAKRSKARGREISVEIHHIEGIGDWRAVENLIYQEILCHPDFLITLCAACHKAEHEKSAGD